MNAAACAPVEDEDVVFRHVLTARVRRMDGVVVIGVDDEALQLDSVAADLFLAVDGHRSVSELASCVAAEYDAPPAEVFADALALFGELVSLGLLQVTPERPAAVAP